MHAVQSECVRPSECVRCLNLSAQNEKSRLNVSARFGRRKLSAKKGLNVSARSGRLKLSAKKGLNVSAQFGRLNLSAEKV